MKNPRHQKSKVNLQGVGEAKNNRFVSFGSIDEFSLSVEIIDHALLTENANLARHKWCSNNDTMLTVRMYTGDFATWCLRRSSSSQLSELTSSLRAAHITSTHVTEGL